jgi:hypothetical protein
VEAGSKLMNFQRMTDNFKRGKLCAFVLPGTYFYVDNQSINPRYLSNTPISLGHFEALHVHVQWFKNLREKGVCLKKYSEKIDGVVAFVNQL